MVVTIEQCEVEGIRPCVGGEEHADVRERVVQCVCHTAIKNEPAV